MRTFTVEMNPDREVTLEAILFDRALEYDGMPVVEDPRPAIIICPGGGYEMLSQREDNPAAVAFLRHGFNTFILRYSIREHASYPNPLVDAARAVRWVRAHAEDLGVDPASIAVMGFSAGGHVTAMLGTQWQNAELQAAERAEYEALAGRGVDANAGLMEQSSRPDAIIPAYAVFNFDWIAEESRLLHRAPTVDCIAGVSDSTPPAFVWTTGEDEIVPPSQSLRFVAAMAEAGVPFEYHHFAHGVHGLGVADPLSNADRATLPENAHAWVDLAARWLRATFEGNSS